VNPGATRLRREGAQVKIVFVGDEHHRYFQEQQVACLKKRKADLETYFWSTEGMDFFSKFDALAQDSRLFLIGSRHGAIPAVHWTARNPDKVGRLVLLHPSLHLSLAGLEPPDPHFVPTMVVCQTKVTSPNYDDIAAIAGRMFHDYSVHLTSEPSEMTSTLSLLALQ
jgi:hypothetical protein